jgi:NifU-like protein involved in Fe-S cluster formation
MYNSTPEIRMLKSIDKKIDEISTMLDDNIPIIEESVTNSGETKFNSNLPIMLNAFAKLETIMKSKVLLQSAIAKRLEQVETKGMSQPVLGRGAV